jgi:electron transport complex protein RnfC
MALGTPLEFVLKHARLKNTASEIILGGPMMGTSISGVDIPITKGVTGILVLTEKETLRQKKLYPCIKCGTCVEACPMHLNPSAMGLLARKNRYQEMEDKFHLMDCFECGCCSFACPSGIPLVQYFRVAKALNRERKAACQ